MVEPPPGRTVGYYLLPGGYSKWNRLKISPICLLQGFGTISVPSIFSNRRYSHLSCGWASIKWRTRESRSVSPGKVYVRRRYLYFFRLRCFLFDKGTPWSFLNYWFKSIRSISHSNFHISLTFFRKLPSVCAMLK